jgi:hypothetical protein
MSPHAAQDMDISKRLSEKYIDGARELKRVHTPTLIREGQPLS